jgi:hypothetical protein
VWGLGCVVDPLGSGEVEYSHRGTTGGYRAITVGRIRAGAGTVLLTNGEAGDDLIARLADTSEESESA